MADERILRLAVDPTGVEQGTARARRSLDGVGTSAQKTESELEHLGRSFERLGQRSKASIEGLGLTTKAEFDALSAPKGFAVMAADIEAATRDFQAGRISLDDYSTALIFARQQAIALKQTGVTPLGDQLTSFNRVMKVTGGQARQGVRGFGTLSRAMGSVAGQALGLGGRFGEVASTLSQFAVGGAVTAGVLAGLAAIGKAISVIRERAKAAAEEQKKLREEFDKLDPVGRKEEAEREKVLAGARKELTDITTQLAEAEAQRASLGLTGPVSPALGSLLRIAPDEELKKLEDRAAEIRATFSDIAAASPIEEARRALSESLTEVDRFAAAFGAGFDRSKARADALRDGIRDLVSAGLGPATAEVQRLVAELEQLERSPLVRDPGLAVPGGSKEAIEAFQGTFKPNFEGQLDVRVTEPIQMDKEALDAMRARQAAQAGGAPGLFDGIGGFFRDNLDVSGAITTAAGNLLSGGLQALIGGAISAIGGLFGESPEERARRQVLEGNTLALDRLNRGIAELGRGILTTSGSSFGGIGDALDEALARAGGLGGASGSLVAGKVFREALKEAGLSFEDAARLAAEFDIVLDGSIQSLRDFNAALDTNFLQQFFQTSSGQLDLARRRFDLLDIDDPNKQISELQRVLVGGTGGALSDQFRDLDFTGEGLDAFLESFLQRVSAGSIKPGEVGDLGLQGILDLLGELERLGDAANETGAAFNEVTSVLNAPQGFRVGAFRFLATDTTPRERTPTDTRPPIVGGDVPPPPGTGGSGGGGGVGDDEARRVDNAKFSEAVDGFLAAVQALTSGGSSALGLNVDHLSIELNGDLSGEEMLRRISRAIVDTRSAAGVLPMDGARSPLAVRR